VTTPATSLPAGSTTWPFTETGVRSVARTGSSTRLVSDPTADDSARRNVVPDGIVTSVNRAAGATGADVAAEIGALVASPVVAAAVSVAVVFSGAFAPLHAASPTDKPITQAHFIGNLHVIRIASRHEWKPDNEKWCQKARIPAWPVHVAKSLPSKLLVALMNA